jgi:hypothetical protein
MSLLRRNKADKDKGEQAVPADATPAVSADKKSASRPGLITRIRNYILDSYNGLYKIVLEPSMPTKQTVAVIVLGLLIGLFWGYQLKPVEFYGGGPRRLSESAQNQWVKAAAAAYTNSPVSYGDAQVQAMLSDIPDPAGVINAMLNDTSGATSEQDKQALQQIAPLAAGITNSPPKVEPDIVSDLFNGLLLPLLIVVIATPILVVVWRLLIQPNIAAPIVDRIKQATNPDYRAQKQRQAGELKLIKEQRRLGEELKKQQAAEAKTSDMGEPVKQSVFIYSKGRNFDESTEIELATGEFLGQCGAVIPDVVAPDPVAVEVWLFDIFGSENKRKIFITESAASNPSLRAQIEDDVDDPATDVIVAAPGATVVIESGKLRLQAKLAAMSAGADGRFESFQLTVQAWQKDAKKGVPVAAAPMPMPVAAPVAPPPPAPAARPMSDYEDIQFDPPPPVAPLRPAAPPPPLPAARPMSDYEDIQFDPPPVTPLRPAAPPPAPAARPMSDYEDIQFDPPPAPPVRPSAPPPPPAAPSTQPPGFGDEDDPFGGTGDFTPLNTGR